MSNADDCGAPPKHGAVCWNELNVRDVERAKNFYSQSLGWSFEGMPMQGFTYWLISSEGARVGGLFEMKGPEFEGAAEHWLPYIGVEAAVAVSLHGAALIMLFSLGGGALFLLRRH